MAAHGRRLGLVALLLGAVVCHGCDFQTMAYFLSPEPKAKASYKALVTEPKKEVTVVIWTFAKDADFSPDSLNADRILGDLLARQLKELATENGNKVKVVSPRKVDEYKNQHPDWHSFDLAKVGRDLRADYVIYLELSEFSLYDKAPGNTLYKGHVKIAYSLTNVNAPDDASTEHEVFRYPTDSRGGFTVADQDLPWEQFRDQFLTSVATQFSWKFLEHPRQRGQKPERYGQMLDVD